MNVMAAASKSDRPPNIEPSAAKSSDRVRPLRRRAQILAIAARIFAEEGFAGATMSQISEAAGILSGSLYHHFTSKEQILHELMKPFGEHMLTIYRQEARSAGFADEVLKRMLRQSCRELYLVHDQHMIMFRERRFLRRTPEFTYIAGYGAEIRRIVYGILQQGVREGSIRDDIDLETASTMILRLTNVMVESFEPGGRLDFDAMVEAELSLIFGGLLSRDRSADD